MCRIVSIFLRSKSCLCMKCMFNYTSKNYVLGKTMNFAYSAGTDAETGTCSLSDSNTV